MPQEIRQQAALLDHASARHDPELAGPAAERPVAIDVELVARWLAANRDRVVAFDPIVAPEVFAVRRWRCRVLSNRNVATFIKELKLALPEGDEVPFRAGGYVQIECPPHELEFRTFDIDPQFRDAWDKFDLWRFKSGCGETVTRAYSMANYPLEKGELLFGTIDTWLIWNLTGKHVTDVTNASRTMLMNLETLDWDADILKIMGVPRAMLPEIRSSSEVYGHVGAHLPLEGIPVCGDLGDLALIGHADHLRDDLMDQAEVAGAAQLPPAAAS